MSNDSQESPGPRNRLYPSVLTQMQIERLKREDEEEHWISGEELYTEGSSDDEEDLKRSTIINRDINTSPIFGSILINRSKSNHTRFSQINNSRRGSDQSDNNSSIQDKVKEIGGEPETERNTVASNNLQEENMSREKLPANINNSDREKGYGYAAGSENFPSSSIINCEETHDAINTDSPSTTMQVDQGKDISWRPKRDSIVELRELQFEYSEILDTLKELKTSLTPLDDSDFCSAKAKAEATQLHRQMKELGKADAHYGAGGFNHQEIVEDVYFTRSRDLEQLDIRQWSETLINRDNIESEIMKITKLDNLIEELELKLQKAMGDTRKEQIYNREELRKLQALGPQESKKLAKYSQEFFELCSCIEFEPLELDLDIDPSKSDDEELESRESRREKLEEKLKIIDKRIGDNFIERNKELASCAVQGGLAITDEEKKRLEELINGDNSSCDNNINIDDKKIKTQSFSSTDSYSYSHSTPYKIDKEADDLLKTLTKQIANINSETYRKAKEEEKIYTREEFLQQKEQLLINSLRDLTDSRSEIIYPITDEEMRNLIKEYYVEQEAMSSRISVNDGEKIQDEIRNDLELEKLLDNEYNSGYDTTRTITQDMIEELIKEAKTTMPLFQFKYETESVIEELENNDKK